MPWVTTLESIAIPKNPFGSTIGQGTVAEASGRAASRGTAPTAPLPTGAIPNNVQDDNLLNFSKFVYPVTGTVTSKITVRAPIAGGVRGSDQHRAIDIGVAKGTPVYSSTDGVVARITNQKSVFGKFLDIALDRINMLIFYSSIILYYLETNTLNINNLWIIIIGFVLYYLYSLLAMIRGLVYSTKRGQGAKKSNILIRINYEFIDSGIYMFLIGVSLYFDVLHILSLYYISISLLFIFGVFYKSYKYGR